jgi:membrane protein
MPIIAAPARTIDFLSFAFVGRLRVRIRMHVDARLSLLSPDNPVEWAEVWLGAVIAALLFTLGKYLISLYIDSSNMASTYGAAGALIIVLVWVYYSVQILLLGAEFAKAYSDRKQALRESRQTMQAAA